MGKNVDKNIYICSMIEIIKKYARENNFDVIYPSIQLDGYAYFRLDYQHKPRYTGHPIIVKVNNSRNVVRVRDLEEAYMAANEVKAPLILT
jgi:hypothetical protein